ncbi:MAG: hypothetical protein WD336_02710 [Trueperaceae bacterium]
MQVIALIGSDSAAYALARYRDPQARLLLHVVPTGSVADAVRALPVLGFAGALVFGDEARREAAAACTRRSLDAEDLGAIDVVTVAGDATLGDHVGGRAVVDGLRSGGWEPNGARVVALGTAPGTRAVLRELVADGAAEATLVARDAPGAERALPMLPAGAHGRPMAVHDPALASVLERCDLLLRSEDLLAPDAALLGPHLTMVDLASDLAPALRTAGRDAGATTVVWSDVEAHRVASGLKAVVGGEVDVASLHEAFLSAP